MILLAAALSLIVVSTAQYPTNAQNEPQPPPNKAFYPSAPVHYVDIGAQLAGDYKFGYDTGKGPMGQSFREEVRLADGSVKGSYGVIDDLGHTRVVHYTSGSGVPISEKDSNQLSSPFNSIQKQSQSIMKNFDALRQHLPVFKPPNYLQGRVIPSHYSTPNLVQREKVERGPTPVKNMENRLPDPLLPGIIVPLYRTSTPEKSAPLSSTKKNAVGNNAQRTSVSGYTQQVPAPVYAPKASFVEYVEQAAVPPTLPQKTSLPIVQKGMKVPEPQRAQSVVPRDKSSEQLRDPYKPQLKQATKKQSARLQKTLTKTVVEEPSFITTDADYYDASPAFIDIERLSYNIGSGRNSENVVIRT